VTTMMTAGPSFWQQPNNANINVLATAKAGQEDGITRGGGGERKQFDVGVAVSHGLIQAAKGNAEPPAYHWTHVVLSPLFDLQSSGGGSRNNLFWLY
jgi:hypothetical protein